MELQVESCMKEEDEVAAATHRHLQPEQGHPEGKEGLSGRWDLWDSHVCKRQQTSRCRGIITAPSHAKLEFSNLPPTALLRMRVGVPPFHTCYPSVYLSLFQRSSRLSTEIHVQYSTACLTVWLCRICLRHRILFLNNFHVVQYIPLGGGLKLGNTSILRMSRLIQGVYYSV